MISDDAVKPGADIVDFRNLEDESRKLPDAICSVIQTELGVMILDHRGAGTGRHDNIFGSVENLQKVLSNSARFVRIPAIERRLAAARLRLREIDLEAEPFQHLSHSDAHLGEDLINHAGDKQRDPAQIQLYAGRFKMVKVQLVKVDTVQPRQDLYLAIEQGNILFFEHTPFALPEQDRELLRSTALSSSSHHKNIAYRPTADKVTGFDRAAVQDGEALRAVMRNYSQNALQFLRALLPRYMDKCRVDFASFRPQEEEGRDLPTKKRNDLLHVDAFPTRPTRGDLILRLFTNINLTKPRAWLTSDPFEPLAHRYALDAGLKQLADQPEGPLWGRLLNAVGFPGAQRSAYDRFMLGFHDYLKFNRDYQDNCPKYRFEFPPDSTWMVFTDVVPHAVLSGRYALEQTVIVRKESLVQPQHAPIEILQTICNRPLAPV